MYQLNVLIPFNMIIDTEMGLLKLIQFDYNNTEYFYPGIINGDDTFKKYVLLTRNERNPLCVAVKDEKMDCADDLYKQFIEKEYSSILQLSPPTALRDVGAILRTSIDKVVKINILCETDDEIELLVNRQVPYDDIVKGTPETISISQYNVLFVKDTKDLTRYKDVEGKEIYVADYEFNILRDPNNEDLLINPEYIFDYISTNGFNIASVYVFAPEEIPLG